MANPLKQVDVLILHCPDARVPLKETLAGVNALHQQGLFKRFGLSNHTAVEIEEVIKTCNENSFVLPSVFEGSYSAVARLAEDEILPLLRKNNIAFYAYSPIAGGFLAKTSQQFRDQSFEGRWDRNCFLGQVYQHLYNRPSSLEALDKWHDIAKAEGISAVEMA